jgi:hypothetical protein
MFQYHVLCSFSQLQIQALTLGRRGARLLNLTGKLESIVSSFEGDQYIELADRIKHRWSVSPRSRFRFCRSRSRFWLTVFIHRLDVSV